MNNPWLMAAGSTGFLLNLLQLVPAKPLDGGFIIQALSKWLLVPGTLMMLVLAFMFHSILLLVIGVISAFALFHQLSKKPQAAPAEQPVFSDQLIPATPVQKILIGVAYLSLAGMLGYLYYLSHSETISMLPDKQRSMYMLKYNTKSAAQEDDSVASGKSSCDQAESSVNARSAGDE